jgi:non-ribosomal peptide synthetase component F
MFYVPLDCAAPKDWLSQVWHDVQPALILTDHENLTLARSHSPAGVTVLDIDAAASDSFDALPPVQKGTADDIAYIFFTSGTSGEPKGVFDTHRNVLHNILRYTNALAIRPDDRLSLLQSPSFSGTVSSLFCALLNGACAYPADLRRESMASVASWIREQGITIYHSVPAIFRCIAIGAREFPSIRIVRLEGDQSSKRDLERFQRHFPDTSMLVNGLGTTETGLVCQFFMDRTTQLTGETLPVGYPSSDIQVQIVDDDGAELPPEHIGEIVVTSRYLAAGYWRRPDLTAPPSKRLLQIRDFDPTAPATSGGLPQMGR